MRMILVALLLAVVYGLLHVAGGRAEVGILSGTLAGSDLDRLFGLAYALAWFGFVLVVPVLLLAISIAALLRRVSGCGNMERRIETWIDSGRR
jgi:hypothetical protein